MATKEDILEQIVEEYLTHEGYFVRHNLKFLPRKDHPDFILKEDSNHSDIDVIGYNPRLSGHDRVWVVSCKSWQMGFRPASEIRAIEEGKIIRGRKAWKAFRELAVPKWSEAFVDEVVKATGTDKFVYVTAVAKIHGDKSAWENYQPFKDAIGDNPIKLITFSEMFKKIQSNLTTTLASTEVGRLMQLIQSSDLEIR